MRRVRRLAFRFASAAALAVVIPASAPAGIGYTPLAPGQVVGAYFPHRLDTVTAAAARDSAGRIVVAGTLWEHSPFTQDVDRSGIALARFAAGGAPDSSFGSAGATVSLAANPAGVPVQVVTPLADGGLLVGTSSNRHVLVERYTSDGRLDASFGSGGIVTAPDVAQDGAVLAVTPLADGTIVVVDSAQSTIMRLSAVGSVLSLATRSGPEWQAEGSTTYAGWNAAHVFPDGSVLVAGSMTVPFTKPCPCEVHSEFVLRRFHADGTVDSSFGVNGRTTTRIGTDSYLSALAVTADGRIVAAGSSGAGGTSFALARYLPDGSLDPSFGNEGTTTVADGDGDALAVGADGSIFVGARNGPEPVVVKLDAAGSPVASFGANGRATNSGSGGVAALIPDVDGGVTVAVASRIGLARYTAAGALDEAFGTPSAPVGLPAQGLLAVAASGPRIAAAGFADDQSGRRGLRVVLVDRGAVKQAFGENGEATAFVGDRAEGTAVGIDPAGRVLVGGVTGDGDAMRWLLARFRPDGTPDPAYGTAGVASSPDAGAADRVAGLAVLPDSRVLVLVHHAGGSLLFRLTASGLLDTSFGDAGRVVVPLADANGLVLTPTGDAVVAGAGLAYVRVDPAGAVDARSGPAVPGAAAAGIAMQHDGQLVIAGTTAAGAVVVRRNTSGGLDDSFGSLGLVERDGLDAVGVAVQRDGRIDVAVQPRTNGQLAVARFLYDGRVDSSFGKDGLAETLPGAAASAIALQDGIFVAGTAPAQSGSDLALDELYEGAHVEPVGAHLFYVRPNNAAQPIAGGTQPTWSPTAKLLAYLSDDDGAPTVSVRPAHGAARQLFQVPLASGAVVAGGTAPQWSPDGKLLAVQLLDADGTRSVAVVSPTGGQPRRIDAGSISGWLAGHRLVYLTAGDELRVADVDRATVKTIGAGIVRVAPHRNLLAVDDANLGSWTIVHADGTLMRRLPITVRAAGWAPDGRRLAVFDHDKLAIVDLTGQERFLRSQVGEEARAPTWSPDGRLIAFVNRTGRGYYLAFVDARTGKPVGRWSTGRGFDHANPTWDRTGVYIPSD
jgi:uncharacterized delta-60 repeat protein